MLAYPVPTDQPISWISLDDAAQYHAYALTHPELAGNILAAPGKESLTGEELAQTFGSVLEQEIKFVSLPSDHFEAAISPLLGEQNAAGLKGLYQWISGHTAILPTYEEVAPDVNKDMELTSAEEWASQTLR
ncbi:hypothetical protein D3C74_40360 [compost metagenome]